MSNNFTIRIMLAWLAERDLGLGLLLIAAGMLFIFYGWRLTQVLIILSAAVSAAALAAYAAPSGVAAVILSPCAALVGGFAAIRWPKAATSVLAGGWAAALVAAVLGPLGLAGATLCAASAVAFGLAASITFSSYRSCVAFVTSAEGTLMIITGAMNIMADMSAWWVHMRWVIAENPVFLPFCLLAGTVIGYLVQTADIQERQVGVARM